MVGIPIVIVEDGILGTRMGFEMMIIDIKNEEGWDSNQSGSSDTWLPEYLSSLTYALITLCLNGPSSC